MMKYTDLVHSGWYKYLSRNEIGAECTLGFPYLSFSGKVLLLTFYPHSIRFKEGRVLFYHADCEISLSYPFEHIERFVRFHPNNLSPVGNMDAFWIANEGKAMVLELYKAFDALIKNIDTGSKDYGIDISAYQEKLKSVIRRFGLEELYQEISK